MRKVALTVVICAVSGLFVAIRGSSVVGQAPATASTSQVSPDPTSWLGDDTPANAACDPDAVTVTSEDAASCAGAGYTLVGCCFLANGAIRGHWTKPGAPGKCCGVICPI